MQLIHFLILIGVLIFVHEFGHYFFAKLFNIRVERFAIGMGPVLRPLSFRKGETEYAICAFPIGGYVKMFGMQPEDLYDERGRMVPEHVANRAFVRKPIWQRAIVILAGPGMNFVFPVFVYFFFALTVTTAPPAMVGQVIPDSPAGAARPITEGAPIGLQSGDRIVSINGETVDYWHDITDHVRGAINEELVVEVRRGKETLRYGVTPRPHTETDRLGLMRETYGIIGVTLDAPGSVVGVHQGDSPAARADLRSFDRIVAIDGKKVDSWVDIEDAVRLSEGRTLDLVVARPQDVEAMGHQMSVSAPIKLQVTPENKDGRWTIGVHPSDMFLTRVNPESPAAAAGLQPGDEIVAVNGKRYNRAKLLKLDIQQKFWEKMNADPDAEKDGMTISFPLVYKRAGQTHETTYQPVVREFVGSFNEPVPEIQFGFDTWYASASPDDVPVPMSDRLGLALTDGFRRTWRYTHMMFNGIVHLLSGKVSTDTVGGPIMIFDIAARAGKAGWEPFLRMMAIISINLGLVNLLPIPILDGGHLMLLSIEAVKRKQLNARTRQIAYYIGLGMIVLLMLLAFKNDIERYWQDFAEWFNA